MMVAEIPQPIPMPLIRLPYFDHFTKFDYWYGLLPELATRQAIWLEKHLKLIQWPNEFQGNVETAVSLHHQALILTGNDRPYLALYLMRPILERVALGWTIDSTNPLEISDMLNGLKSENQKLRRTTTQSFVEEVKSFDPLFQPIYDMVAQYFAHASNMDNVAVGGVSEKDKLFMVRARIMPLILIMDVAQRLIGLFESIMENQSINFDKLVGGRDPNLFQFDIGNYLRLCSYVTCEKHTPANGVPISTLVSNSKNIQGDVGLNSIYRGGMNVVRMGTPDTKPHPKDIADFCVFAIGRGKDETVKVKLIKEGPDGEEYKLSWSKDYELDAISLTTVAAQPRDIPFFDYITSFLKLVDERR